MIRTQVYILDTTHKELTRLALQRDEPMAKLVREFIDQGLKAIKTKDCSGKKTLQNIVNLKLSGGPKDLSKNLDYYLYRKS